jgi:hypothetical protein
MSNDPFTPTALSATDTALARTTDEMFALIGDNGFNLTITPSGYDIDTPVGSFSVTRCDTDYDLVSHWKGPLADRWSVVTFDGFRLITAVSFAVACQTMHEVVEDLTV